MFSKAKTKFDLRVAELQHLNDVAVSKNLKPTTQSQKQLLLHSHLTGLVAAWDSYLKSIVPEFMLLTSLPTDTKYNDIFTRLDAFIALSLDKLNTPNFENARNFLVRGTGYDPINEWIWRSRGLNAHTTRERLNEILKVRHSFAHGFAMPLYNWNSGTSGKARLTIQCIKDVRALLVFLVLKTDTGLQNRLNTIYGITNW